MATANDLTDIKLDLKTGFVHIDDVTNDAVIIKGNDVILQDTAIRLRTQIGTVKRQTIDGFGWNFVGRIKNKLTSANIQEVVDAILKIILEDTRIDDAEVAVTQNPIGDDLNVSANIRIGTITLPLTVTV